MDFDAAALLLDDSDDCQRLSVRADGFCCGLMSDSDGWSEGSDTDNSDGPGRDGGWGPT
jgi:hypothetical protein